jgi:uncharacterized protein (TIGR02284 family)
MQENFQIVNDLLTIHEELMSQCQQTASQFDDGNLLRTLFVRLELESRTLMTELLQHFQVKSANQENGGKIYRIWKVWIATHLASLTEKNDDPLSYFQVLEEAVIKAYHSALYSSAVSEEMRELLKKQLRTLRNAEVILNRFKKKIDLDMYL